MTELMWEGKYKDGKKAAPVRLPLPFQDVETVNESAHRPANSCSICGAATSPPSGTIYDVA